MTSNSTIINEIRTDEQIRTHYEIEKQLAYKLKNAPPDKRKKLYCTIYNELFSRVTDHPQLKIKFSPQKQKKDIDKKFKLFKNLLSKQTSFLEIGAGDCLLSVKVCHYVKQVYAIDVSNEITKNIVKPDNFKLIISDGCSIPIPINSVDVAYSSNVMEHLHLDDAYQQLKDIYDKLVDGGIYVCNTPNKLSGPHDISRYFDDIATGLHIHEYTAIELYQIFKKVGFYKLKFFMGAKGIYFRIPFLFSFLCEWALTKMPSPLRKQLASRFLYPILGILLIAYKND